MVILHSAKVRSSPMKSVIEFTRCGFAKCGLRLRLRDGALMAATPHGEVRFVRQ